MNAVCLYVSTAQLVLQSANEEVFSTSSNNLTKSSTSIHLSEQKLNDLNYLLTNLRLSLTCSVCCRLLNDPYAPRSGLCQHNVCKLCMPEPKSLRPFCNVCKDCQDFKSYDENRQLRSLLLCYKSLCEYLNNSTVFAQLGKQKVSQSQIPPNSMQPVVPLPNMSLQEFILEGCEYEDITNAFSADLPRLSCFPRVLLPSSTISTTQGSSCTSQHINVQITQKTATLANNKSSKCTTSSIKPSALTNMTTAIKTSIAPHQSSSLTTKYINGVADVLPFIPIQKQTGTAPTTIINRNTASKMSLSPALTYMDSNTSGIVVPIVSSSGTTTAPLTIASAKLQSLNRHLMQSRNVINVSTSLLMAQTNDSNHPHASFKMSQGQPTSTATVTSQEIRNTPPIKTVSNGSSMYSVLYTGTGNKITIKRKIDGFDNNTLKKNASSSVPVPIIFCPLTKSNSKRRGCRCGNATPTPGKLTCCGQRCPCYVDSKSCIGCKCRGCRNPHRPDGGKVRPIIPQLACYDIQVADENSIQSSSDISISNTKITPIANQNYISQSNKKHTCQVFDDNASKESNILPQLNLSPTMQAKLIPISSLQRIAAANSTQQNFQTITNLITSTSNQQTPVVGNVKALDSQPRDAMLIQNTNGKYQVVNVLAASNLQRIHTITSQLQTSNTTTNTSSSLQSANNSVILPNSNVTHTTTTSTGNISASSSTNQIIIQPHNQQHHMQTLQRMNINNIVTAPGGIGPHSALHNNIVTLHPMGNTHGSTTQQTMQLVSASSASPTARLTFSPIIVTSPNNFMTESVSNYVNLKETTNGSTIGCSITASSSHVMIPTLPND